MKKLFTIAFLFIAVISKAQLQPFMAIYPSAAVSSPKVAKIDFRSTGTSTGLTNWNTMAGDPGTAVVSVSNLIDTTGANTGWSVTSKATANWVKYTGCSCSSNNSVTGITGGTAMPGASTQSYQSIWFTTGTVTPVRFDATKWQLEIGGLDNSKTYTIGVSGSVGQLGFDARNFSLTAIGASTVGPVEIDGGPGGGAGFTTVGSASYGEVTVQPSGGIIKIFLNSMSTGGTAGGSPTGSDIVILANARIKQN